MEGAILLDFLRFSGLLSGCRMGETDGGKSTHYESYRLASFTIPDKKHEFLPSMLEESGTGGRRGVDTDSAPAAAVLVFLPGPAFCFRPEIFAVGTRYTMAGVVLVRTRDPLRTRPKRN